MNDSSQTVPDRWIDRWGHWILWMGPYILIVSLLSWTPRLVLLLCGIELMQFTLHVRDNHPTHLMTPISALFVGAAVTMFVVGSMFYPISLIAYILLFLQIMFSRSVHKWIHSRESHDQKDGLMGMVVNGVLAVWVISRLIVHQIVPGFPGFYAYLTLG